MTSSWCHRVVLFLEAFTPARFKVARRCRRGVADDVQLVPQSGQWQDLLQAVVFRPLQVPRAQCLSPQQAMDRIKTIIIYQLICRAPLSHRQASS